MRMIVPGMRQFRARLPGDGPAAVQRQRGYGDGDQQVGPGIAGAEYSQGGSHHGQVANGVVA